MFFIVKELEGYFRSLFWAVPGEVLKSMAVDRYGRGLLGDCFCAAIYKTDQNWDGMDNSCASPLRSGWRYGRNPISHGQGSFPNAASTKSANIGNPTASAHLQKFSGG